MLLVRCQIGNGIREPYKLEILVFFFFLLILVVIFVVDCLEVAQHLTDIRLLPK